MPPSTSRRPRAKTKASKTPQADPRPDVLDQLRRAIREDGRTHYALAAEAGCHRIQIGRFMSDPDADLKGSTIAKLAKILKLELRSFGRASKAA